MKKRYQIDREKAVRRFQQEAAENNRELQLALPLKQVAADLQEGAGELMRRAGLELMQLVMEDEVRQLAGERCRRRQDDEAYRWGSEQGFLVVDGHEQASGSYKLFRRNEPLDETVWDKLMLGLSTRDYSKAACEFVELTASKSRR